MRRLPIVRDTVPVATAQSSPPVNPDIKPGPDTLKTIKLTIDNRALFVKNLRYDRQLAATMIGHMGKRLTRSD